MKRSKLLALISTAFLCFGAAPAFAQNGPDLIFRKSVDFKLLTPNDKLATYGIDDPVIDGVVCYYTAHEKGGVAGMFGVAEQSSEVSLACRQYAPIKFKEKFGQGDTAFSERRSLLFKRMHIVRGCDAKRNVLIYMVYSDKLVAYLNETTHTIRYAEALGHVRIQQQQNTALSQRAIYEPAVGKITLVGQPSLLVYPSDTHQTPEIP